MKSTVPNYICGKWCTRRGDSEDGRFSGKVGYRLGLHFSSVSSPRTALPDRLVSKVRPPRRGPENFFEKSMTCGKRLSRVKCIFLPVSVFLLVFFHGDLMLSRPCVASGLVPGFPVRKRWSRLKWRCVGPPVGAGGKIFSDYRCDVERW